MLGLCGVNMPLIYGEGGNAFVRLQSEIMKVSDDESVFAWFCNPCMKDEVHVSGVLASSPKSFAMSGKVELSRQFKSLKPLPGKKPFSITNKGVEYHLPRPSDQIIRQPNLNDRMKLILDRGMVEEGTLGYMAIDLIYFH